MATKIKRLVVAAFAVLLLAGGGLLAFPVNEVAAGATTSDPSCDPPMGG